MPIAHSSGLARCLSALKLPPEIGGFPLLFKGELLKRRKYRFALMKSITNTPENPKKEGRSHENGYSPLIPERYRPRGR
jgi:hypothetical protein